MKNGKIVQVMGPVIDVEFEDELPKIKDALEVELDGKKLVMEVSQHTCIMLRTIRFNKSTIYET